MTTVLSVCNLCLQGIRCLHSKPVPRRLNKLSSLARILGCGAGRHHDAAFLPVEVKPRLAAFVPDPPAKGEMLVGRLSAPYLSALVTSSCRTSASVWTVPERSRTPFGPGAVQQLRIV